MSTDFSGHAENDPAAESVSRLQGVTKIRIEQLQKLGLLTMRDLIFHFPRRYEDLSRTCRIDQLKEGETQVAQGEVVEMEGRELPNGMTIVSIILQDGGNICLEGAWFNRPYISQQFRFGQRVAFTGKVKWYRDHFQMSHPRVQHLDESETGGEVGILPVYPLTEDLPVEELRKWIRQALDRYGNRLVEILPESVLKKRGWPGIQQAIREVHFPPDLEAGRRARHRFVYEEFLVLQLGLALRRRDLRDRQKAPVLKNTRQIDAHIRRLFPFAMTADQDKAIAEVCKDLSSERPMQRLLQADVGAGKTAVAVYALLVAVANKHQAALMAPTEVLAQQHWQTLERYLSQSRVRRLLLTGSLKTSQRKAALDAIRSGEVDIVVGTQALVQQDIEFAKLGLIVIDEQHKFGVNQRAQIRRLGIDPHYLVMTATPIPRTMALTVFGDLDVTVMRELPPGRLPVQSRLFPSSQRDEVYTRIEKEVAQGKQAYVVCPLVEESDRLELQAAEQVYEALRTGAFAPHPVGLLHGRLDDEAKASVMGKFRQREFAVLVCTSVVEVGVDVPNATLMVVEEADRFGLSQLHQLRGRVSRGSVAGQCYLLADPTREDANDRLKTFVRTRDGFLLAEEDARRRGSGQLFGTRQHGLGELRFANPIADVELLKLARKDAFEIVLHDAGLNQPEHALLRKAVIERFGKTLELVEVG